jgi:uncharacterized protein DUF2599
MTLYAPAEPTLVRPYTAPQQFCAPGEPTLVRGDLAQEHLDTSGEATVIHGYVPPQKTQQSSRQSTARTIGRAIDWIAVSVLALSVCAFICQQAFGAFRPVETAAEFPLSVAMAAVHGDQQESYVGHTEWTMVGNLPSLRVYPTAAGRQPSVAVVDPDAAWAQVVALSPDAGTPGMREQFVCHLRFAEFAEPGKVSWNIEPWRPIVNGASMIESRCNPGGAEERL